MYNTELNGKYLNFISKSIVDYLNGFTVVLSGIEKARSAEFLSKYKIEASQLNMTKVEKLLRDYFTSRNIITATDIKNGLIAVFKKIKIDIASSQQITYKPLNYEKIEEMIKNEFREYVNSYAFSNVFNYVLNNNRRSLSPKEDEVEEVDVYEKYTEVDSFSELVDLIIAKLDNLEDIVDSYGLNAIHSIEYNEHELVSLENCIEKKKYSKLTSINLKKICETLQENDKRNYFDFTSEDYVLFVITLFDAMHVTLDYYDSAFCQKGEDLIVKKDLTPLISNIKNNLFYFLDLELLSQTDFIRLHSIIYNDIAKYDYKYYETLILSVESDVQES